MKNLKLALAAGLVVTALSAAPASATLVYDLDEFSDHGAYGQVIFDTSAGSQANWWNLSMQIHNTTDTAIGGALTSLGMMLPAATTQWSIADQGGYNFTLLRDTSLAPFGLFDACLATGQNCQSGNVPQGIAAGDTATIILSGYSTAYGDAAALETALANAINTIETGLCAKFEGLSGGNHDKVCGEPGENGGLPGPGLPEPASLGFLGAGLAGLFLARRRRRA